MIESKGSCETHHLPLDRNGECELCRLSDVPSKIPPSPSALWIVIIPLALILAVLAWVMHRFESAPDEPPPSSSGHEVLAPDPDAEGSQQVQPSIEPSDKAVPEWKMNLARRRVIVTMYATPWCSVCKQAREYMKTNRIEFIELNTDENAAASERLGELNPRKTVPTFEIDGLVHVGFQQSVFEARLNRAARAHL